MRKFLAIIIISLLAVLIFNSVAQASMDINKKYSEASKELKEKSNGHNEGEAKIAVEHESEEGGGHEQEAAWRIAGWQSIFTIIAILYYIGISLTILPKIAARKVDNN